MTLKERQELWGHNYTEEEERRVRWGNAKHRIAHLREWLSIRQRTGSTIGGFGEVVWMAL